MIVEPTVITSRASVHCTAFAHCGFWCAIRVYAVAADFHSSGLATGPGFGTPQPRSAAYMDRCWMVPALPNVLRLNLTLASAVFPGLTGVKLPVLAAWSVAAVLKMLS